MALGVLWYARMPATSTPWHLEPQNPATYLPPLSYVIDLLPAGIIFGLGLSLLVAPLTTALMRSVPAHNAGLGSAINNAISRVGPQLAGALIFVFITASFYSYIATRRPDLNAAFHLAMMVGAVLLVLGAIVNAVGIRDPGRAPARQATPGRAQPAKEGV
jgi:hypothetical protein